MADPVIDGVAFLAHRALRVLGRERDCLSGADAIIESAMNNNSQRGASVPINSELRSSTENSGNTSDGQTIPATLATRSCRPPLRTAALSSAALPALDRAKALSPGGAALGLLVQDVLQGNEFA